MAESVNGAQGSIEERLGPGAQDRIVEALRHSGARFAFLFGSSADGTATGDSDVDVAAWWGEHAPAAWQVRLPSAVDLVVLDTAPLWLAGRVAQHGRMLFDDDPPRRVEWQAETRVRYLDRLPLIRETQRTYLAAVADGR